MMPAQFIHQTCLRATSGEVYKWHENPSALKRLSPRNGTVEIIKPALLSQGSIAHLRILFLGNLLHIDWLAELEHVRPGREFSDRQLKGPFKMWKHRHIFIPTSVNNCIMRDEIEFVVPGGTWVHSILAPLILKKIQRVFIDRHRVLIEEFGEGQPDLFNANVTNN